MHNGWQKSKAHTIWKLREKTPMAKNEGLLSTAENLKVQLRNSHTDFSSIQTQHPHPTTTPFQRRGIILKHYSV